jgi:Shikimate 5-dehydrogenase
MLKFGLIGNPIAHSKSPALFKAAYNSNNLEYNIIEADTCQKAMEIFNAQGYKGINITAPFKNEIMNYSTHPDRISSLLSAANILIKENGELHSYNSDYYGVTDTLKEFISEFSNKSAIIIGAGGAGKAAALAAKDIGFKNVSLTNRSNNKVIDFCNKIGIKFSPFEKIEESIIKSDVVIYALSVKLPNLNNINFKDKIFFEANYANPQFADCNANIYIKGEYWLLNQAVKAFELFTHTKPNTLKMRELINI